MARRTPVVGHWGSEWTGDYDRQSELRSAVEQCADRGSWSCVEQILISNSLSPSYLLVPANAGAIREEIRAAGDWELQYENPDFVVFGMRTPDR